jgi:hypothetical protein
MFAPIVVEALKKDPPVPKNFLKKILPKKKKF